MAIDATELTEALAAARISGSHCQDAADLARQMEALNAVIESTFQTFATEIINIINNGGGGATTPVYILRALVNKVGGVAVPDPANQADPNHLVPFDGWSVLFSYNGDPPTFETGSQVARNVDGRSFQDNEVIKIISFNGTTWLTDKIADDDELIAAYVNKPGDVTTGDTWFYFTGAVAIDDGFAPAGGTGVALNLTGNAYAHNERLVLRIVKNQSLIDAANPPAGTTRAWFVMQDDDDVGGSGGTGQTLTPWFGIYADRLINNKEISLDYSPTTGFDADKLQAAAHNTEPGSDGQPAQFRWLNIDVIEINLV